jgi:hypothetical protein
MTRGVERDARARIERSSVSVASCFFVFAENEKDENVRNVSISKTRARVSLVSRRIASYRVVSCDSQ